VKKTLADIQKQIEKLELQAKEIRAKEVQGVVTRIREAIDFYGLTVEELFGAKSGTKAGRRAQSAKPRAAGKRPGAKKGMKVAIKYRDQAGNTWTGRGLKPRWLQAELAAGKKLEDFAV
jgi:DNA-binding protein H-NS